MNFNKRIADGIAATLAGDLADLAVDSNGLISTSTVLAALADTVGSLAQGSEDYYGLEPGEVLESILGLVRQSYELSARSPTALRDDPAADGTPFNYDTDTDTYLSPAPEAKPVNDETMEGPNPEPKAGLRLNYDLLSTLEVGQDVISGTLHEHIVGGGEGDKPGNFYPSDAILTYAEVTGVAAQEILEIYGLTGEWPAVRQQIIEHLDHGYSMGAKVPGSVPLQTKALENYPVFNRPEAEALEEPARLFGGFDFAETA